MRVVFFILLLANALALAYFLTESRSGAAAARPPLRPEAIRLARPAPQAAAAPGECMEWVGLTADDLPRARAALEALGLGDRIVLPGAGDHWVHIPPLRSREEAEKKLAELMALGVAEATIVEEGPSRHAISLATFASAEEAGHYLRKLQDKGVKSARVAERAATSEVITLVRLDEGTRQKVERLRAEFAQTELRPVSCRLP